MSSNETFAGLQERVKALESSLDFHRNKVIEQNVTILKLMEARNDSLEANIELYNGMDELYNHLNDIMIRIEILENRSGGRDE